MHQPDNEEMAAIAAAYLLLQREQPALAAPLSRWRLAARAFANDEPRRSWRSASRVR
jgi:hypothetical protein